MEIENAILSFIEEMRQPGEEPRIAPDTRLMELGVLDSMGLVRLIQFVEQNFGISIPEADVTPDLFASPRELAAYIAGARQPA